MKIEDSMKKLWEKLSVWNFVREKVPEKFTLQISKYSYMYNTI